MNAVYPFQKSPRCTATSKRTKKGCKAPAVAGWTVCRFHGARGGAPTGKRNGMYRHGDRRRRWLCAAELHQMRRFAFSACHMTSHIAMTAAT
jgi:hypothetical protein